MVERVSVASSGACTLMAFLTRAYQARHFLCRPRPLRFLRNLLTDPDLLHPCLLPLLPHSKRCNGKRSPNLLVVEAAAEMDHSALQSSPRIIVQIAIAGAQAFGKALAAAGRQAAQSSSCMPRSLTIRVVH